MSDDDGRVDAEGMGDDVFAGSSQDRSFRSNTSKPKTNRGSSEQIQSSSDLGDIVESWHSLTRLFPQGTSGEAKRRSTHEHVSGKALERSVAKSATVHTVVGQPPGWSSSTLFEEPASLLHDKLSVPLGHDPLAFLDDKALLEIDTETQSDNGETDAASQAVRESVAAATSTNARRSHWALLRRLWNQENLSPLARGVTKCVIAYLLASLFTYCPFLANAMANLLPNHDAGSLVPFSNLHMLATVAVYFHPARTFGSMIEADIFALVAFAYSMLLSIVSMLTAERLHDLKHPNLSNTISVVFFLGGGMALVGWAKLKVGKPTFNTACSLVYVSTFSVMVKEGSTHLGRFETDKAWQVSLVVLAGTLVSNLVCFVFWPQRATTNLVNDISRSLDAYATLLKILTRTFLLEDPASIHIGSSRLVAATKAHHNAFASLGKNLAEARYEAAFDSRMRGRTNRIEDFVTSLQRLGQNLGGLRSSCLVQSEILASLSRQGLNRNDPNEAQNRSSIDEAHNASLRLFLDAIGPHLRSLVFSCARTLQTLDSTSHISAWNSKSSFHSQHSMERVFDDLDLELRAALKRFQHEQNVALRRVYTLEPKKSNLQASSEQDQCDSPSYMAGSTINAAAHDGSPCDEAILVVFFFIFNMEELTREIQKMVHLVRQVCAPQQSHRAATYPGWFTSLSDRQEGSQTTATPRKISFLKSLKRLFAIETSSVDGLPYRGRHALDTAQTPRAVTWQHRWSRWLWRWGQFFRKRDIKFAIKAGFGCALLASPAFIHRTRPTFVQYQGQWALVSFMVVLSPTVGQSNQMSLHRLIGTIFGACVAVIIYMLFRDNNIALPIFGAIFSVPCFRYIVGKPHLASSGRFVLLTFNLTCLYAYNFRKTGLEAEQVGFQRTIAVALGVIWATILNHLLWPNEARRELSAGLSELLSQMAWLCQHTISASPSVPSSTQTVRDPSALESQTLVSGRDQEEDEPTQHLELYLRLRLLKLESLLVQTKHEPRLKGPFPVETYRKYLMCCTEILDKLHSIRCVTRRQEWHSTIREDWVVPVNSLRREMVGNMLLFFHILASAMDLKTPVPPYLPPAERSRQALLDAVRELPVVKRRAVREGSQYLLSYSYCLAMKDVIHQLEKLGELSQDTFGVLGGSISAFEAPFRNDEHMRSSSIRAA